MKMLVFLELFGNLRIIMILSQCFSTLSPCSLMGASSVYKYITMLTGLYGLHLVKHYFYTHCVYCILHNL